MTKNIIVKDDGSKDKEYANQKIIKSNSEVEYSTEKKIPTASKVN